METIVNKMLNLQKDLVKEKEEKEYYKKSTNNLMKSIEKESYKYNNLMNDY